MSQPASFDMPRPGETILACSHSTNWKRRQYFVGHKDKTGKPTGLGAWVRLQSNPDGLWVRWVSLCGWCRLRRLFRSPFRLCTRSMLWQHGAEDQTS